MHSLPHAATGSAACCLRVRGRNARGCSAMANRRPALGQSVFVFVWPVVRARTVCVRSFSSSKICACGSRFSILCMSAFIAALGRNGNGALVAAAAANTVRSLCGMRMRCLELSQSRRQVQWTVFSFFLLKWEPLSAGLKRRRRRWFVSNDNDKYLKNWPQPEVCGIIIFIEQYFEDFHRDFVLNVLLFCRCFEHHNNNETAPAVLELEKLIIIMMLMIVGHSSARLLMMTEKWHILSLTLRPLMSLSW